MTYSYDCDGFCPPRTTHHDTPAFMGELNKRWFTTDERGAELKDNGFTPNMTITLCPECAMRLLLDTP